jgi:hypothetical protein
MSKLNTMYSSSALNKIDKMPETISELYNLAIELNQRISNCLAKILPDLEVHNQKTVRNLLYYPKIERTKFIELLYDELNNSYRAFYNQNKELIKVYMRKEKMRESSNWIKKSLDALEERIKNLEYLCQRNRDLSEVDFLILYLGLRDYCSNMFQQMSANYDTERLSKACQELVALADQVSDEIGEAYTAQR